MYDNERSNIIMIKRAEQLDFFDIPAPAKKAKGNWLAQFKNNLKQNMGYSLITKPILLYNSSHITYDSGESDNEKKIYQDDVIMREPYVPDTSELTYNNNHGIDDSYARYYHAFDPIKHLITHTKENGKKILKYRNLEHLFVTKCRNLNIVLNNELLKNFEMNYHVVILNAVEDYVLNYYPLIAETCLREEHLYDIIHPALMCLAFVNDDGSYFLAIPYMQRFDLNYDYANTPVIKTSLLQVSNLLKNMQFLARQNNNTESVLLKKIKQAKMPDWVKKLQGGYLLPVNQSVFSDVDEEPIDIADYDNRRLTITEMKDLMDGLDGSIFLYDPDTYNSYNSFLEDLTSDYKRIFESYIVNHLRLEIESNGTFKIYFDKATSPFWGKVFSKASTLNLNMDSDARFKIGQDKLAEQSYLWEGIIVSAVSYLAITKMNLNKKPALTKVEDIAVNSKPNVKPLMSSKGLNQIFLSLRPGKNHKYYISKDTILSMYCSSNNEHGEQPELSFVEGINYDN